ncbi:MAG: phage major capsid protein [bacterium]
MNIAELIEQRDAALEQARLATKILDRGEIRSRATAESVANGAEYDLDRARELDAEIRSLTGTTAEPQKEEQTAQIEDERLPGRIVELDEDRSDMWYDTNTKRAIRAVPKGTRFFSSVEENPYEELSLGSTIRSMFTGPRNDVERRALSEGVDAAGGFTVPTPLAGQFIDLMRAKSHVMNSGAVTLEIPSETLRVARLSSDPSFSWRAENATVGESEPTFGSLTFTPRSTACLFKASRELLQDAANIDQMLEQALSQAAAQEIDRIALFGSGVSNEPTGLINTVGINSVSMGTDGAAITNYVKILEALQALEDSEAPEPTAMIMAPRTKFALAGLTATDNQPLIAPAVVSGIPQRSTSKVPVDDTQGTATDASRVIMGDFTKLYVGMRQSLRVEILQERYADSLQVGFLAHMRLDIQLIHPSAFCELVGITP